MLQLQYYSQPDASSAFFGGCTMIQFRGNSLQRRTSPSSAWHKLLRQQIETPPIFRCHKLHQVLQTIHPCLLQMWKPPLDSECRVRICKKIGECTRAWMDARNEDTPTHYVENELPYAYYMENETPAQYNVLHEYSLH